MQVQGNGSSASWLRWFQDRTTTDFPQAWVFSVPMLVYRGAMLAWWAVVGLVVTAFAFVGGVGSAISSRRLCDSTFSIGIVIVAGLAIGTLFTLFVLPVIYTFLASEHKPLPEFDESIPAKAKGNH